MNKILLATLLLTIACSDPHIAEFNLLKPQLSNHFQYSLKRSELSQELNCRKITLEIEGKAKTNLRLKNMKNVFLQIPSTLPLVVDEGGFQRIKEKQIAELRTQGIQEHCLEVKDFECIRYYFRDTTERDLLNLIQKIDGDYAVSLKKGETLTDQILMTICPQRKLEVSYLVQLP
ncbi:MAG TPA: hypothetical protein VKY27_01180 [Bacteriovoracaceae bacterium]|nr:hypothetical protein [Bacteriovoracaceae bacterium]